MTTVAAPRAHVWAGGASCFRRFCGWLWALGFRWVLPWLLFLWSLRMFQANAAWEALDHPAALLPRPIMDVLQPLHKLSTRSGHCSSSGCCVRRAAWFRFGLLVNFMGTQCLLPVLCRMLRTFGTLLPRDTQAHP